MTKTWTHCMLVQCDWSVNVALSAVPLQSFSFSLLWSFKNSTKALRHFFFSRSLVLHPGSPQRCDAPLSIIPCTDSKLCLVTKLTLVVLKKYVLHVTNKKSSYKFFFEGPSSFWPLSMSPLPGRTCKIHLKKKICERFHVACQGATRCLTSKQDP